MGKPLDSFKTLHEKRVYRKFMQILNDPTHPMRHYFDSRPQEWKIFYFREQIQTVTESRFYPLLCQFLMKIIPVINWVCACVKTSVEDDNFLREGWVCVNLMILFNLRVFTFWFVRESIIPGNFGFAISVCRLRERGRMSKSVYVRVFHDLELLRDVLRCAIERQL